MITREMKDKGMTCKGKSFNCPDCIDKLECVDYTGFIDTFGVQKQIQFSEYKYKDQIEVEMIEEANRVCFNKYSQDNYRYEYSMDWSDNEFGKKVCLLRGKVYNK